ncbi:hypothetical protein KAR91_38735 [Candidatus Pacearchaeota archaeon]|nr:hypothetical protein [Candidatus Pacearchaeota archaeon]
MSSNPTETTNLSQNNRSKPGDNCPGYGQLWWSYLGETPWLLAISGPMDQIYWQAVRKKYWRVGGQGYCVLSEFTRLVTRKRERWWFQTWWSTYQGWWG